MLKMTKGGVIYFDFAHAKASGKRLGTFGTPTRRYRSVNKGGALSRAASKMASRLIQMDVEETGKRSAGPAVVVGMGITPWIPPCLHDSAYYADRSNPVNGV